MLQDIIKTVMIGTEKLFPAVTAPLMLEVEARIAAQREDKEDAFLKLTAAYLLLQEAGRQVPQKENVFEQAPTDSKPQISAQLASIVQQLMGGKEEVLLDYALYRIAASGKVVRYDLLPDLLNLAVDQKDRQLLLQVCGERGKWLARLNDDWKGLYAASEAEHWETGTLPQRKAYVKALRAEDPQQARALLEAGIAKENANTRAELLELMMIALSPEDEPFLESLCKDKSQKVKQLAYTMLKMLPHSSVSRQYQAFLKEALLIREERKLLLGREKVLELRQEVSFPEALADSGLDKMSSQQGVGDVVHWVSQTLEHLHPSHWQTSWDISVHQLVALLARHKQKSLFMNSLFNAAFLHRHQELALALLQQHEALNPQILQLLPLQERYAYAEQFLDNRLHAALLLPQLMDESFTPIPLPVCRKLLQVFSTEPYAISQPVYHKWALYMPDQLLPELEEWLAKEAADYQQRFFRNVVTEMIRIIETKKQLNASL